jgi:fructose-bisphosphate aldolase class II
MARITLRQLLDHAAENDYGVPAFNINNMEQGLAIMNAAKKADSPVILQASRGARSYAGDIMLRHMIQALTEMYPDIPIVHAPGPRQQRSHLHLGDQARLHLGDDGRLAQGRHEDAGRLGLQRRHHQAVAEMAHWVGASVEGELGVLGSLETGEARRKTARAPRASSAMTSC